MKDFIVLNNLYFISNTKLEHMHHNIVLECSNFTILWGCLPRQHGDLVFLLRY